ncbi:hypothetical protein [Streptomyces venezuelae]|uniref:hypothetical protein n=1 Tax=Streptomyces venezuelae TaxID=54571 RepID=UPI0034490A24
MTFIARSHHDDAAAALLAHIEPFSSHPLRLWDGNAVLAYLTGRAEPVEFWDLIINLHRHMGHEAPEQEITNPGMTTAALILTINSLTKAGRLIARPRAEWEKTDALSAVVNPAPHREGEMYYTTLDLASQWHTV